MNKNWAIIIAAGGGGNRFGSNKLLEKILDIPVFIYSIKTFLKIVEASQIYFVCPNNEIATYAGKSEKYLHKNIVSQINFVAGGKTRVHSVSNGLNAINENMDFIAVHDAARPLISKDIILDCIKKTEERNGAIVAKKIVDTIKMVDKSSVSKTINRDFLCAAETPQCFNLKTLKKGYDKILSENIQDITDDASVFEFLNKKVEIVYNNQLNLKITYQEDIIIAENYLKSNKKIANIALSVGGNIGDVKNNILKGIDLLKTEGIYNIKLSSFYKTKPIDCPKGSNDFINAAIVADTILSPQQLLIKLKEIEKLLGREEIYAKNSPRHLDIDIILYDDLILNSENLIIPHKEATKRKFVLEPLAEIAPNLIFYTTGLNVNEHLRMINV